MSAGYYRVGQYYVDTSTPTAPVLWRCTTAGDKSSSVWAQISAGAGGGCQQFLLVASGTIDGGDYWNCNTWDGATRGGSIVKVAKPWKLRCVNGPTTESIRGATYGYTYATDAYSEYVRTTTITGGPFSGAVTTDYLAPAALASDTIIAIPFATTAPSTLSSVARKIQPGMEVIKAA